MVIGTLSPDMTPRPDDLRAYFKAAAAAKLQVKLGAHSAVALAEDAVVAMDLFVVPTISFPAAIWFADHGPWRRQILWCCRTKIMRTHLSLNKDAPISRAAENAGRIICRPILGGLHHQYGRM